MKSFCDEFSLVDIFRVLCNEQKLTQKEFTKSSFVKVKVRLLEYLIQNISIKAGNHCDHSIISLDLEITGTQNGGKKFQKCNISLLTNPDYVTCIKSLIA